MLMQVSAATLVGGISVKFLFNAVFNANLVEGVKRLCGMQSMVIVGETAEGPHSGDCHHARTEDREKEERDASRSI
jgi:hypothetical protein